MRDRAKNKFNVGGIAKRKSNIQKIQEVFGVKKAKKKEKPKKRMMAMGGGFAGRRMGYKFGSNGSSKGKVPTTPKEKSLAKLAPPKDRITFGDVVAGRTKGKRMQARKGTLPLTKRNIKEGEPGKIKKLPFDNISEEKKKLKSQRKP